MRPNALTVASRARFDLGQPGDVDRDRLDAPRLLRSSPAVFSASAPSRSQIATAAPESSKPLDDRAADALRAAGHHRIPARSRSILLAMRAKLSKRMRLASAD